MSFAIWYACYTLLQNSNKRNDKHIPVRQVSYVHNKTFKGKKCSVNSLRKKFNNDNRGGSCL